MNKNNQNKHVSDSITLKDTVEVVRYKGAQNIREMIEKKQYIEAFIHTQLGIEKILWDKIVGIFEGEKAMMVSRTINESRGDKSNTRTYELIKWAHILGAIDDNDFKDLKVFNKARNSIMHGHGKWWSAKDYLEALQKGISFLEKNGL